LKLGYSNTKKLRGIRGGEEERSKGKRVRTKKEKTKQNDTEVRRMWNVSKVRRRGFLTPIWKEG